MMPSLKLVLTTLTILTLASCGLVKANETNSMTPNQLATRSDEEICRVFIIGTPSQNVQDEAARRRLYECPKWGPINVKHVDATKPPPASPQPVSSQPTNDISRPLDFDLSQSRLPPNFRGTDLSRVIHLAEKAAITKRGEFESTAEFTNRVQNQKSRDVGGGLTLDTRMAFVVTPVFLKYDADGQAFDLSLSSADGRGASLTDIGSMTIAYGSDYTSAIIVSDSKRVIGVSQGVTGLGVKADFVRVAENEVGIAFKGYPSISISRLHVPPDVALLMKPNLKMVIIGRLATPPVVTGTSAGQATLRSLTQMDRAFQGLLVDAEAVWFADIRTGEIIEKQDVKH